MARCMYGFSVSLKTREMKWCSCMCISGDVIGLTEEQWGIIEGGMAFCKYLVIRKKLNVYNPVYK